MKSIVGNYQEYSLVEDHKRQALGQKLLPVIKEMTDALRLGYKTHYASLCLPSDEHMLQHVESVIDKMLSLRPSILLLIGIGGSNMGTLAIAQALLGLFYNELNPRIRFYCADTIDTELARSLLALLEAELQKGNPVIITLVTKSGTTTETIANASLFLALIKKYYPQDYYQYVAVVTSENSPLADLARREGFYRLDIPENVGGRYAVLSGVGLLPLGILGIDIRSFWQGALAMRPRCISARLDHNPAAQSAITIYAQYCMGKNIHDTFIFTPRLAKLGSWYRQLVGESLGKKENNEGIAVYTGITPMVSIGTTDLHSVGQLYLGGPYDKLTTFIYAQEDGSLTIPKNECSFLLPMLEDKTIAQIKQATFKGVQAAYANEDRPFMTMFFPEVNASILGEFIMLKMCEVIYTAYLMNVNPFDQPAVELYKRETKGLLDENY